MAHWLGIALDAGEQALLEALCKEWAARWNLEEWRGTAVASVQEFLTMVRSSAQLDMCWIDVLPEAAIEAAEETRRRFRNAKLLLLATPDISPMRYMKPSVRAAALLLRPVDLGQAQEVLRELVGEMAEEQTGADDSFVLETRKTRIIVPYAQIECFEARDRRIYLCTQSKQYTFYDTLEGLLERLPTHFIRCHKGYVINSRRIRRIDFSENLVYLDGGYRVPVSRSHKAALRELSA